MSLSKSSSKSSSSSSSSRHSTSKLEYLYEFEHIPDEHKVPLTDLPLLNPYSTFLKPPSSFKTTVQKLIHTPRPSSVKEYIQASKFDQCFIPATEEEQLIKLDIPNFFVPQWIHQGYTHLHFGAIRIALTFHGKKGLPMVSRIALLDTRFVKYEHAYIATVQTTLNTGTVLLTFYPNFNMPLKDPYLLSALQV